MKTAEEIISYLESEVAKHLELHNESKGKDAQQAFESIVRVALMQQILDEIKG